MPCDVHIRSDSSVRQGRKFSETRYLIVSTNWELWHCSTRMVLFRFEFSKTYSNPVLQETLVSHNFFFSHFFPILSELIVCPPRRLIFCSNRCPNAGQLALCGSECRAFLPRIAVIICSCATFNNYTNIFYFKYFVYKKTTRRELSVGQQKQCLSLCLSVSLSLFFLTAAFFLFISSGTFLMWRVSDWKISSTAWMTQVFVLCSVNGHSWILPFSTGCHVLAKWREQLGTKLMASDWIRGPMTHVYTVRVSEDSSNKRNNSTYVSLKNISLPVPV